jgi:hypothetical protein
MFKRNFYHFKIRIFKNLGTKKIEKNKYQLKKIPQKGDLRLSVLAQAAWVEQCSPFNRRPLGESLESDSVGVHTLNSSCDAFGLATCFWTIHCHWVYNLEFNTN